MVTYQQQPNLYNSQFSDFQKCNFTIYLTSQQLPSPYDIQFSEF